MDEVIVSFSAIAAAHMDERVVIPPERAANLFLGHAELPVHEIEDNDTGTAAEYEPAFKAMKHT